MSDGITDLIRASKDIRKNLDTGHMIRVRKPLPKDRTFRFRTVMYHITHPSGWFLIYDNDNIEYKCNGHHVMCCSEHFFETLQVASDLDTAITCILNTDENERKALINHLNHEGQYWEDE